MAWALFQLDAQASEPGPSLRTQAMRLLARREHSREELRRKLKAKAREGEDLEALLDELARRGWLSDVRVAEQAARAKAARFGPRKLAHYLRGRGISEAAIAEGLRKAGPEGESSLETVWRSRFRGPPCDEREKLRQVRFLQGRGFEVDEIFRFLNTREGR